MPVSQSVFDAATPQAEHIRSLTYGFIIAASAILLLVVGLTMYMVIKYRAKNETTEPRQTSGNLKLEIFMVGIPTILVIIFFFWSLNVMNTVNPDRGTQKPDIIITGHQWWWQAVYPGSKAIIANE